MKSAEFQKLLLRSAVSVIACDGSIDDAEISALREMGSQEIYFRGCEYELLMDEYFQTIKKIGLQAIEEFFDRFEYADLTEQQSIILVGVLVHIIESDDIVDSAEVMFLQRVIAKLNIDKETLIMMFPKQISYLFINRIRDGFKDVSDV